MSRNLGDLSSHLVKKHGSFAGNYLCPFSNIEAQSHKGVTNLILMVA